MLYLVFLALSRFQLLLDKFKDLEAKGMFIFPEILKSLFFHWSLCCMNHPVQSRMAFCMTPSRIMLGSFVCELSSLIANSASLVLISAELAVRGGLLDYPRTVFIIWYQLVLQGIQELYVSLYISNYTLPLFLKIILLILFCICAFLQ